MSHIQVFDPETAELLDYPFGSLGSVRSWQPVGADEAASLGAGICEYRGVFDWDLHYDAVYFLLSGSLYRGRPGRGAHGAGRADHVHPQGPASATT